MILASTSAYLGIVAGIVILIGLGALIAVMVLQHSVRLRNSLHLYSDEDPPNMFLWWVLVNGIIRKHGGTSGKFTCYGIPRQTTQITMAFLLLKESIERTEYMPLYWVRDTVESVMKVVANGEIAGSENSMNACAGLLYALRRYGSVSALRQAYINASSPHGDGFRYTTKPTLEAQHLKTVAQKLRSILKEDGGLDLPQDAEIESLCVCHPTCHVITCPNSIG